MPFLTDTKNDEQGFSFINNYAVINPNALTTLNRYDEKTVIIFTGIGTI